jgi:hypothetical protein
MSTQDTEWSGWYCVCGFRDGLFTLPDGTKVPCPSCWGGELTNPIEQNRGELKGSTGKIREVILQK